MIAAVPATHATESVVLLHGLGRTSFSMARLAHELEREGYHVINVTYPSRSRSLETLATEWLPARLESATGSSRVHFVTHSMGGILVRLWLRECGAPANLGRVVMLAPPNAGSEVTDRLASFGPYRWTTGVNGTRLGTSMDAVPRLLGAWPVDAQSNAGALGIIAGDRPLNALMAGLVPAPNDGKVSVASTHLAGERDHVVLPFSHTWLGWRRLAIEQVKSFLRRGEFVRVARPA
jgi:triacylglycerol lipase